MSLIFSNSTAPIGPRVSLLAVWVFFGMPLALVFNARFGFDRMTTLNWRTPITMCAALCVASVMGYLATENPLIRVPVAGSDGKQLIRGVASVGMARVAYVIAIALVAGYITGKLLGALAPYIAGPERSFDATVAHIVDRNSPRNPCQRRLTAWARELKDPLEFCLSKLGTGSIGTDALRDGEQIKLTVRTTVLGTAAVAIERTGA